MNKMQIQLIPIIICQIFRLDLVKGPYKICANQQTIYLAGSNGHIASFNWRHKQLECEFEVKETVRDIKDIAQRNFAVAQKDAVYIYDPKGVEVHKIRNHKRPKILEYLTYHYLLASANVYGQLVYQDITRGNIVSTYNTQIVPLCMKQNFWNGVLGIGDQLGVVKMYSPNTGQALASILCHRGGVSALGFTRDGHYLVTGGSEGLVKIWDLRTYKLMEPQITTPSLITSLSVSDKGIIAVSCGKQVIILKDAIQNQSWKPYMRYSAKSSVQSSQFIQYEDYLALGTQDGFEQLIVPESGEPNFDTYEAVNFQTKKQRKETNVRSLIEKLPFSTISLNPQLIGTIDRASKDVIEKEKQREEQIQEDKKIKKRKKKMRGKNTVKKLHQKKESQRESQQQEKWQQILSDSLRVKKAEKEKRKQEMSILRQLENVPLSDIMKGVK